MTTVRATCQDCGDIETTVDKLVLHTCVDTQQITYSFPCPNCGLRNSKEASAQAADVLAGASVAQRAWHLPQELFERHAPLPVLTADDLLDFHNLLESPNWLDGLYGSGGNDR